MTRNPPPPHRDTPYPPDRGDDIDVVAGDPPVPLTVWRVHTDPPSGAAVPGRLAARLVSSYSRPGDTVIDATDGHVLGDPAGRGGRRHHPAIFTSPAGADTQTLAVAAATDPAPPDRRTPRPRPAANRVRAPRTAATAAAVEGTAALVVAGWPLHPDPATAGVRTAALLTAASRLLRGDGCLALVAHSPAGTTARPEDFGPLIAAAHHVGLGYLQHIVAVHAGTAGDRFTYHATAAERRALAAGGAAHVRVHADVVVFTPTGSPDD